ncbi:MAG TPA: DUF2723 domain-containing protein [Chitinophagaceae bacterium]|nr:DUF2723 domain-containing protein [Chitinophagaceae bacterium]
MNFKRINNITGWAVCLVACTVYILTTEAGGSLWDCGEFVSSCYKLQIPHPPGAPLFVLMGRLFIILFGNNPMTAAKAVNIMSALASGFTILFLFWTITYFARRVVKKGEEAVPYTTRQVIIIMAAGAVGALAYTFTDSFWYSAVEGEVYATSSFFTAIVFWAILKWESVAERPGADKWIVFIFFLIGLSIGVHLLCLLCIPPIVMMYYAKRHQSFNYKILRKYFIRVILIGGMLAVILALMDAQSEVNDSRGIPFDGTMGGIMFVATLLCIGFLYLVEKIAKQNKEYYGGAYIFLVIGAVIFGLVQKGVIQFSIKYAGAFDVYFVNNLGMPFFTGFAFFFLLLAVIIWWALRVARKKNWQYLRLGAWCFAFTLIGYSTYLTTMIRSNADPGVDVFNVDNPESLAGYLGRDQYGDFPIIYGQKFDAQPVDYKEGDSKYEKGKDKYIDGGKKGHYVFMPQEKMIFPRMWDMTNDQGHADYYAYFMNAGKAKDGSYDIEKDESGFYTRPNFADNMKYFINYQTSFMYLRYFFWNFSGKQNDLEGLFNADVRDGNWITGIPLIDNAMYGDQNTMPDSLKNNKSHNSLFMLPFIFGLIGMFYQLKKKEDDGIVTFLLFFMTGFAVIIYLNQSGYQPRERDYAYVGSFYAFAIWIGLAVPYLAELAANRDKKMTKYMGICGGVIAFILLVSNLHSGGGVVLGVGFFALFAAVAFGIPYLLKMSANKYLVVCAVTAVSLLVPLWMGVQEWDDHDRSKKQVARDIAKDYLESCAPNAILFTIADNDTYPLWYAQEVEGIRPDVRVVITTLISADWCIDQLRYKINKSAPVKMLWTAAQVEGDKRDVATYQPQQQFAGDKYYNLTGVMNYIGDDKNLDEHGYAILPTKKISIPVDEATVRANGTVNPADSVVKEMDIDIPKNNLYKNDLAILDVIAANQWKRPIYFTMPYGLGFDNYLRKEGLSYRLVPVQNSQVNTDRMMDVVMNKFGYGSANLPNVYFDEENRRQLNIIRRADAELALDLDFKNRKDDAKKVVEKADKMMLQGNFPYGMVSRNNDHNRISLMFLEACYRADDKQLAAKVSASVRKDLQQQVTYYNTLQGDKADFLQYDKSTAQSLLSDLDNLEKTFNSKVTPKLE